MHIPKTTRTSGVMLIQLLIGIVVIIILSGIVAQSLTSFTHQQALENDADGVTALIASARDQTLAGENGLVYGVHLEDDEAVLFSGDSYAPGSAGEKIVVLDHAVTIQSVSLAGGGNDIVFEPLTGNTEEYGTFIIKKIDTDAGAQVMNVTHAGQVSSS